MKLTLSLFLLLTSICWATDKKLENQELHALTGLQKFEVVTLFLPENTTHQKTAYNSITEAFKKIGRIAVSENESMFKTLLQFGAVGPICLFSIEIDEGQIELSLDVLAEAEVTANHYKTACSVWKKTLYSLVPKDNNQTDASIANLVQEMIKSFSDDWLRANNQDPKQLFFHIRKFEGL